MTAQSFLDERLTIHTGDCLAVLAEMAPDSVDCVVTSPPYWGLRDYGVEGQHGLETTLAEHIARLVEVFEAVRRVLKPTGTLWLNYGDCYATTPNGRSAADTKAAGGDDRTFRDKPFSTVQGSLKPKDLCMLPNRLAIALQDAGWWVRSEIIWGKPNPMPDSSGAYRPSTAHEKIFMLTKSDTGNVWRARDTGELSFTPDLSERCALITRPEDDAHRWVRIGAHYDAEAVRMGMTGSSVSRLGQDIENQAGSRRANGATRSDRPMKAVGKMPDAWDTGPGAHGNRHRRGREKGKMTGHPHGRHVLGEAIPEHQRRASQTKQRGHGRRHDGFNDRWDDMTKAEQGASGRYLRNYEPAPLSVWPIATKPFSEAHFATFPPELAERCILAGCPKGGVVLDPYGGAGTTALVALRHHRRAVLIELNPDYAAMARDRILTEWAAPPRPAQSHCDLPLFNVEAAE